MPRIRSNSWNTDHVIGPTLVLFEVRTSICNVKMVTSNTKHVVARPCRRVNRELDRRLKISSMIKVLELGFWLLYKLPELVGKPGKFI